jgi:hypothetical protein
MLSMLYRGLLALICTIAIGQIAIAEAATRMKPSSAAADLQRLITKARRQQDSVRVILSLIAPFASERELPKKVEVREQRTAIVDAQTAVLAKLRGCEVASVTRYKFAPAMAMEVDACGLERLTKIAEVKRIAEDVPVPLK